MTYVLFQSLYILFLIIQMALFLYILLSWLPNTAKLREVLYTFLGPIFALIRSSLTHSVFNSAVADLTPMVALILISYLQSLFYNLSM